MKTFSKSFIIRLKPWYWVVGILCLFFLVNNSLQSENDSDEYDSGDEVENVGEISPNFLSTVSIRQWSYSDQTNHKRCHFAKSRRIHIKVIPKKPNNLDIIRLFFVELFTSDRVSSSTTFLLRPSYYTHLFLYALF